MRNVARLKMGYYPLPEAEGVKLRSLLSLRWAGFGDRPLRRTRNCAASRYQRRGGSALWRRTRCRTRTDRTAKGIETIQGNAFDAIARPESFSLLYLNPPYDSEIGSIANRRMEGCFWNIPTAGWRWRAC